MSYPPLYPPPYLPPSLYPPPRGRFIGDPCPTTQRGKYHYIKNKHKGVVDRLRPQKLRSSKSSHYRLRPNGLRLFKLRSHRLRLRWGLKVNEIIYSSLSRKKTKKFPVRWMEVPALLTGEVKKFDDREIPTDPLGHVWLRGIITLTEEYVSRPGYRFVVGREVEDNDSDQCYAVVNR